MTHLIEAREFAEHIHKNQKRKGKETPYSTHLRRVVQLLEGVGADPNVIIAGWLHDTIEDQGISIVQIKKRFGIRVAGIVLDLTEPEKTLPWIIRKGQAIERVCNLPHDSLLVKTADFISNIEEITEDYRLFGDRVFDRFNAPKEPQLASRKNLFEAITTAWPENPLLSKLEDAYQKFIFVCNSKESE